MPPAKQPLSFPIFSRLAIVFIALVLLVFLVVAGTTGGSVEIQVKPAVTERSIETFLNVSAMGTPDVLPAEFEEKTIEQAVPVKTGPGVRKEQKSRFGITIHNQYSRDQTLVRTTRLLHNNLLYRLVDSVTVRAGTSLPAVVESDAPGMGYELRLGDRLSIPGLWPGIQSQIFGIVDKEVQAGVVLVHNVKEEEVDAAEQKALQELEVRRSSLSREDQSTLVFINAGEIDVDRPEAQESENPSVLARQRLRVVKISRQAFFESLKRLVQGAEQGKQSIISDSLANAQVIEWEADSARLHVAVPVGFYDPIRREDMDAGKFRGKSEQAIREILQSEYGIVEVAVNYSPAFLKPLLPKIGRVRLTIIEP